MNEYKILLLGSDRVGKTTFFQAVTGDLVEISYNPTLVVNIGYKLLELNKKKICLRIWDVGGQVFLRDSWVDYYIGADGYILFYDITRRYTFDDVINWKQDITNSVNKNLPCILVGNKSDLKSKRQVNYQEGKILQQQIKADGFCETSTLYSININEVIEEMAFSLNKGT